MIEFELLYKIYTIPITEYGTANKPNKQTASALDGSSASLRANNPNSIPAERHQGFTIKQFFDRLGIALSPKLRISLRQ
jgi:hypothetical protein